jgi:hypothetical protein
MAWFIPEQISRETQSEYALEVTDKAGIVRGFPTELTVIQRDTMITHEILILSSDGLSSPGHSD